MQHSGWPFICLAVLVSGCNQGTTITGAVTLGGKKLSGATITLVPDGATNAAGVSTEIRDGKFEFTPEQGLKRGKHKVIIMPLPATPDTDPNNAPLQFKTWESEVDVKSNTPLNLDVPN